MAARQQERSKAIFVVRTLEPVKSNPQNASGTSKPAQPLNPFNVYQPLLQGQKQVSREFLLQSEVLEMPRGQNPIIDAYYHQYQEQQRDLRKRRKKRDYIQKKKDRFVQMSRDAEFDHQLLRMQGYMNRAL